MAKLAPIITSAGRWGSGRHFEAKLECRVLKDGIFRAAVPEELQADFQSWIDAESDIKAHLNGGELSSDKLSDLQVAANKFALWKVETENEQFLRIWFRVCGSGSYYLTPNKDVTPIYHENSKLFKGTSGFFEREHTAGVAAQIRLVTRMTDRKGNVTFKHDHLRDEMEVGNWGTELISWGSSVAPSNPNMSQKEFDATIPYTERAAQFFCTQMKADMQRRNDLKELLEGSPESVSSALNSDAWPMPFFKQK